MSLPPRNDELYGPYGGGPGSYHPAPRGGVYPGGDRAVDYGVRASGFIDPYMSGGITSAGVEGRRATLPPPVGAGPSYPYAAGYDMYGPPPPGGAGSGGRRSPEWEDRRNKRRRSISPRRDPYFDQGGGVGGPPLPSRDWNPSLPRGGDYRHGPPPSHRDDYYGRAGGDPYSGLPPFGGPYSGSLQGGGRRNGMDPPESLPYQVTHRYFTEWTRMTTPSIADSKEALDAAWRKYKIDFTRKGHRIFFEEWKKSSWFKEKYDPSPEYEELRAHLMKKGREGKMQTFVDNVKNGLYDAITIDQTEVQTTAASVVQNGAEEAPLKGVPTEDEAAVSTKEKSTEPDSSSATGKETEPDSKSNGVTVDNVAEAPLTSQIGMILPNKLQLFIKTIPSEFTRQQIEEKFKEASPEGFDYLILSEPNPTKKWHRVAWVQFKEETDMQAMAEALAETKIDNFTLHIQRADQTLQGRVKFTPIAANTPERIRQDRATIRTIASKLETREELEPGNRTGSEIIDEVYDNEMKEIEAAKQSDPGMTDVEERKNAAEKKALDLFIEYLRTAFNTCYYCTASFDFKENLDRSCALHKRRKPTSTNGADDKERDRGRAHLAEVAWLRTLDEKLPLLLKAEELDPRDYGGESYEEELHKLCHPKIKHEEEGKFRCKECNKLFSALKFVEKHLLTKHAELFAGTGPEGDILERVKYFNNYVMDPNRLPHPGQDRDSRGENGSLLSERIGERENDRNLNFKKRRGNDGFADGGRGGGGMGIRRDRPPPPPPEGAMLDPRARRGASSYADLDEAPAGDVILNY